RDTLAARDEHDGRGAPKSGEEEKLPGLKRLVRLTREVRLKADTTYPFVRSVRLQPDVVSRDPGAHRRGVDRARYPRQATDRRPTPRHAAATSDTPRGRSRTSPCRQASTEPATPGG